MPGEGIEAVPKEVIVLQKHDGGMFAQGDIDPSQYVEKISAIRDCIVTGTALPATSYRKSTGRDFLFEEQGWLHLHVDHMPPDDVLLFVQEDSDHVIFIGLARHNVFTERPRGKSLFGLRGKIEKARLQKVARRKAAAAAAKPDTDTEGQD